MCESECDYEYQSETSRRDVSSSGEEESEAESGHDDTHASGSEAQDIPLQLCPRHPAGEMVEACISCSMALGLLRPEVAEQMISPLTVSSVVSRYAGRSYEKTPTMLLLLILPSIHLHKADLGERPTSGIWLKNILHCLPNSMRGLCRSVNWSHYSRCWRMKSG